MPVRYKQNPSCLTIQETTGTGHNGRRLAIPALPLLDWIKRTLTKRPRPYYSVPATYFHYANQQAFPLTDVLDIACVA